MRKRIIFITTVFIMFLGFGVEAGVALESHFSAKFKPVIDGQIGEWLDDDSGFEGSLFVLGRAEQIRGQGSSAEYAFAHNGDALTLAMSIKDKRPIGSKKATLNNDHIELWFGVNNPSTKRLEPLGIAIFVDPDNTKEPIEARWLSATKRKLGKKVPEVRGAFAVNVNDYSVEVQIPWSVLPRGAESRFGLRAALFVLDSDKEDALGVDSVLGTASFDTPMSVTEMPLLTQSDLTAPLERFWKDAKMRSTRVPHSTYVSNLVGDKKPEQLVFAGSYVMAYGGEINAPKTYVSFKLPVRRSSQIIEKTVQDLTGDGRDEIVIHFLKETGTTTRRWVSIYQITDDMKFNKIFSAATLVSDGIVKVENKFKIVKGKGKTRAIVFTPSIAQGVDRNAMQEELPAEGGNIMVVPWDRPPQRKYVFHGGSFIQQYKGMR